MRLLLASTNEDVIKQLKYVFQADLPDDLELVTLEDIGYEPKITESNISFEMNAVLKAIEPTLIYPDVITVADDRGIFFESLKGLGGIGSFNHENKLCREVLLRLATLSENFTHRGCYFEGACAVAWRENDRVKFHVIHSESNSAILKVKDMTIGNLKPEDTIYQIIERSYLTTDILLSDMLDIMLMDSIGVLEPYSRLNYFIRQHILEGSKK